MSEVLKAIIEWPVKSDVWEKWRNIYNGREKYENICGPKAALKYYQANKKVMDEGAVVLWPERQSLYSLMVAYEENELAFMSEMQNSPRDAKDCIFNTDDIQYWTDRYPSVEDLLHALGDNAEHYGACDPSLGSQNLKGDYSAIICLVRDKRDGVLYVIEADLKRRTPDETITDILAYYKRYQFIKFGLETNQFQKLMMTQLEEKGRKAGLYISIEQFNNTVDKVKRIQNLQPLVKSGTIKFSRHHKLFLEEVRDFPRSAHDDGLDCAEMAVRTAEEPGQVQVFICGGGSLYDDFDDNAAWNNCFK
jgi:predicted phage terminase large subunit-like protein